MEERKGILTLGSAFYFEVEKSEQLPPAAQEGGACCAALLHLLEDKSPHPDYGSSSSFFEQVKRGGDACTEGPHFTCLHTLLCCVCSLSHFLTFEKKEILFIQPISKKGNVNSEGGSSSDIVLSRIAASMVGRAVTFLPWNPPIILDELGDRRGYAVQFPLIGLPAFSTAARRQKCFSISSIFFSSLFVC